MMGSEKVRRSGGKPSILSPVPGRAVATLAFAREFCRRRSPARLTALHPSSRGAWLRAPLHSLSPIFRAANPHTRLLRLLSDVGDEPDQYEQPCRTQCAFDRWLRFGLGCLDMLGRRDRYFSSCSRALTRENIAPIHQPGRCSSARCSRRVALAVRRRRGIVRAACGRHSSRCVPGSPNRGARTHPLVRHDPVSLPQRAGGIMFGIACASPETVDRGHHRRFIDHGGRHGPESAFEHSPTGLRQRRVGSVSLAVQRTASPPSESRL